MDNWTSLSLALQYRIHENDCFLLAVAASGALLVSGICKFTTDVPLCLLPWLDSGQPFLCGPQSSGEWLL